MASSLGDFCRAHDAMPFWMWGSTWVAMWALARPPVVSLEFPWVPAQAARLGRALSGSSKRITLQWDSRGHRGKLSGYHCLTQLCFGRCLPCSAIAGIACRALGLHPHMCCWTGCELLPEPGSQPGNRVMAFLTAGCKMWRWFGALDLSCGREGKKRNPFFCRILFGKCTCNASSHAETRVLGVTSGKVCPCSKSCHHVMETSSPVAFSIETLAENFKQQTFHPISIWKEFRNHWLIWQDAQRSVQLCLNLWDTQPIIFPFTVVRNTRYKINA